jgi:hypothetical protein
VSLTYVWRVNGTTVQTTPNSPSLTDTFDLSLAGHGNRGDVITVQVTPSDGTLSGTAATTGAATVINSAPTVTVNFSPASPHTNDMLTAVATPSDPDNDPVSLTYVWRVNGNIVPTTTGTLDLSQPGNGDRGQTISVQVTPSDGTLTGTAASAITTVSDTPPTATVTLNTASPRTNDTLTATATRFDVEGDPVTLTYVWKVNGSIVKTTPNVTTLTDTLNLATAGNGDRGDTVTVEVTPNDGTVNGTTATAIATVANTPPAISLPGGPVTFIENSPPAVLDATATAADVDFGNFDTGTLTVDFSANGAAEDRLSVRNQGTGSGQVGVSGNAITYGGTQVATFTGGTGTTPLVITFNTSSSIAAVQAVARNLTYEDVSDNPLTAVRTVRLVMTDGDGGTSNTATKSVSVTPTDDPPAITLSAGVSYTENAAPLVIAAGATVTDPDSTNFLGGTLTVSFSANGTADDALGVNNQGTASGQIGVSGGTVTYGGSAIGTFTGGTGTTPLVFTLSPSASLASLQALLGNITFRNGSDNPSTTTRTVSFALVQTGGPASTVATTTVDVVAVNDPPVIALPGPDAVYAVASPSVILDATATVTDPDSPDFGGGTLTVDITANGSTFDRLSVYNQGSTPGQVGVSGSTLSYGGTTIGTVIGGAGSTPLSITFNTSATLTAVQAVVQDISFNDIAPTPSTATRTVRFVLTDGDGGTSNAATKNVQFLPPPNLVYVDDNWPNPVPNQDPDGPGGVNAIFGFNAFATIQAALTAIPTGGTVVIRDGSYSDDVTIAGNYTLQSLGNAEVRGLTATGGTLSLSGQFTSKFGNFTFNAPVILLADTTISTAGGGAVFLNNTVTPATNGQQGLTVSGHNVTIGDLGTTAALKALSVTAAGDLDVGSVTAVNGVTLTSTGGSINDANGPGPINVSAATLTATAAAAIELDTAVNSVTATSTSDGAITLREADAVTLTSLTSAGGPISVTAGGQLSVGSVATTNMVSLTASGAIVDANGAALNVSASVLSLTAGAGIGTAADPLEIAVGAVDKASAGLTGGIYLTGLKALTLTGGVNAPGDIIVSVPEHTPIGPGDDLTVAGGASVVAQGSVILSAGDVTTVQIGGKVQSVGGLVLQGGLNDNDGSGGVTLAGMVQGFRTLITGGAVADSG